MDSTPAAQDAFTIERHGEVTRIAGTSLLETLDPSLNDQATRVLLELIRLQDHRLIVCDLGQVVFFGPSFPPLLLRCWKLVMGRGGQMVLAGVSDRARELRRIASLDMIWPIYAGRR